MACPFIQICAPIYNGVSPCSTFAHQKLTTSTTNISRTWEIPSRASSHLCIDKIRHQTEVCCTAQTIRTAWRGDSPSALAAPAAAHRGCPEWVRGMNATLVQLPEHGRTGGEGQGSGGGGDRGAVRRSGLCRAGCAHETASGPRSLAEWGYDHRVAE